MRLLRHTLALGLLAALAVATAEPVFAQVKHAPKCTIAAGTSRVFTEGGTCGTNGQGDMVMLTDTSGPTDCGAASGGSAGGGTKATLCAYNTTTGDLEPVSGDGGAGGEANTTADVGGEAVSIRGTTPKTDVALNVKTFEADDFSESGDTIIIDRARWMPKVTAADCTGVTTGVQHDICQDTDDDTLWRCTTATCNASGWTQITGGSGITEVAADTSPSLGGPLDGDNFGLFDLGPTIATRLQPMGTSQSVHLLGAGDVGWQFGANNPVMNFTGTTSDNVFGILYNLNLGGSGIYNPFNPAFAFTIEGNYGDSNTGGFGGTGGGTWWEWHLSPQRTESVLTVDDGSSFSVGDRVSVRDLATGMVLATARLAAKPTANELTLYWLASVHNTDRPADNDPIESENTTTVGSPSGTFNLNSRVWVSDTSSCAGLSDTTYTALLVPVTVASWPDFEFYVSKGDRNAVSSGNCIQQAGTGFTGLLGTVTPNAASAINEVVDASDHSTNDFRWITSAGSYQDLEARLSMFTNDTQANAADTHFRIVPSTTQNAIAGRYSCFHAGQNCNGHATQSAVLMGQLSERTNLILAGEMQMYGRTGTTGWFQLRTDGTSSLTTDGPTFLWAPFLGGGGILSGFFSSNGAVTLTADAVPVIHTANRTRFKASPVTISDAGVVAGVTAQRFTATHSFSPPNGVQPTATCTVGDIFLDTDETDDDVLATTSDNTLVCCTAPDTWGACNVAL